MIRFNVDERQQPIRDMVREFAEKEIVPVAQELDRSVAVDQTMVEREGQVHHVADDDLVVANDRALLDHVDPEYGNLRLIDNRCRRQGTKHAGIGQRRGDDLARLDAPPGNRAVDGGKYLALGQPRAGLLEQDFHLGHARGRQRGVLAGQLGLVGPLLELLVAAARRGQRFMGGGLIGQ